MEFVMLMTTKGGNEYMAASIQGHILRTKCSYSGRGPHTCRSECSVVLFDCNFIVHRKGEFINPTAISIPVIKCLVRLWVHIQIFCSGSFRTTSRSIVTIISIHTLASLLKYPIKANSLQQISDWSSNFFPDKCLIHTLRGPIRRTSMSMAANVYRK